MSPSNGDNGQPEAPLEPSHHRGNHTHAPIVPYSVTTLTPVDSGVNTAHQLTNEVRRSESPVAMATIPPPAILHRGSEAPQSGPGVYYSIAEDGGRSLTEDGQFLSSRGNGRGSGRGSLGESESSHEREEVAEEKVGQGEEGEGEREGEREREGEGEGEGVSAEEEEEVLGKVTEVVKAVMELSNRVSLSTPEQYVELVKVILY